MNRVEYWMLCRAWKTYLGWDRKGTMPKPDPESERHIRETQMLTLSRDATEWVLASRRGDSRGMKRNEGQIRTNAADHLPMLKLRRE